MRRDMDLVRRILMTTAESGMPLDAEAFANDRDDFEKVAYHIDIMAQAGLIEGMAQKDMTGGYSFASVVQLTWEGNDFLDSVKNDKVWSKVKQAIAKTTGGASFEVVKTLAVKATESILLQQF